MAEFLLDGDPIRFGGAVPSSLQDLLVLVERSLASSGRVLAGARVDGHTVTAEVTNDVFASAHRIEFVSVSLHEAIAQVAAGCSEKAIAMRSEALDLSMHILREPWDEAAPKLISLGERLGGILQDLGSLAAVPEWGAIGNELAADVDRWMDAVAARDAAGICLCFVKSIVPRLDQVAALGGARPATSEP